MNFTDKHIIESYKNLLEGLNENTKLELIENLSKSLKQKKSIKENAFYKSFGAFCF
jgi:deoxyhypusine synthase